MWLQSSHFVFHSAHSGPLDSDARAEGWPQVHLFTIVGLIAMVRAWQERIQEEAPDLNSTLQPCPYQACENKIWHLMPKHKDRGPNKTCTFIYLVSTSKNWYESFQFPISGSSLKELGSYHSVQTTSLKKAQQAEKSTTVLGNSIPIKH